jgi:hypothetical protein
LTIRDGLGATVDSVDEAVAVLERLDRVERLRREGAPAGELLEELRALLAEAEDWARLEGGVEGENAVRRMRSALEQGFVVA